MRDIVGYQQEVGMPNVLIRDISQEDLELLDEQARRAPTSCGESSSSRLADAQRRSQWKTWKS